MRSVPVRSIIKWMLTSSVAIGAAVATAFRLSLVSPPDRGNQSAAANLRDESARQQALWEKELAFFSPVLVDVRLEAIIDESAGVTEYVESIEAALDRYGKFVLLGDSGAGKTTLLRQLAATKAARYQQAQDQDYIVPFPVWINLGDSRNPPDAELMIKYEWKDKPRLKEALELDLDDDFLCLLFDGLNELPDALKGPACLENRVKSLADFLVHYDGPAVVTCRTSDYDESLNLKLPVVRILKLEPEDMAAFARKRLGPRTEDFGRALQGKRQMLAETPFTLSILLQLFEAAKLPLPDSHMALYDQFIEHRYDKQPNRNRADLPTLKRALGNLACQMMLNGNGTSVDKAWANRQAVGSRLRSILGQRTLDDALSLSLLIENTETQQVSFYHPALYEHLALSCIDLKRGTPDQRLTLVKRLGGLGKVALPLLPDLVDLYLEESRSANAALYNQVKHALIDIVIDLKTDLSRRFILEVFSESSLLLSLQLAKTLNLEVDLTHDTAHDRDRTLTLDVALDLAIDRARDRLRDLGYAYLHSEEFVALDAHELGLALELAYARAQEVALDRDRAPARAHDLAVALERAYTRIGGLARTIALTVNLNVVNSPDGFLALRKNVQHDLRSLAHELKDDRTKVTTPAQGEAQRR